MSSGLRRKRRPAYTVETLSKAIEEVKSGETLNVISRKYKIPRTTLHARVTKKHSSRLGKKPALSDDDEADLARWVERMCSAGCSVSRNQISDSVLLSLKSAQKTNPFVNARPGHRWFDGFFRRHRLRDALRRMRRDSLKGVGVDGTCKWFADLSDRLRKDELHRLSRKRTYSIGEVSLPLHLKANQWCAKEGPTVLVTANAAGALLPPTIIFDSNDASNQLDAELLPRGWSVQTNDDADVSAELLYDYVKNQLYPWLLRHSVQLPVVLFLYQQLAAYLTQVLCDFCDKRKIFLAILPSSPHQATSPVEISLFPILKREFMRKLKIFVKKTRVQTIGKNDFVARLEEALYCTNVEDHLENGFYKCGLYPLSAERYIRACIKVRPEEDIESLNENQPEELPIVDQSSVLKCIESNLDPATIESFRSATDDRTWTGKVEDTNLFYLWRKVIKSIEMQPKLGMLSDSDISENQENKRPSDYTLDLNPSITGEKHKPLSFISNNLNNENLDRSVSIIVVHPNARMQESDSDEA